MRWGKISWHLKWLGLISIFLVVFVSCNQKTSTKPPDSKTPPSDLYFGESVRVFSGTVANYDKAEAELFALPNIEFENDTIGTGKIAPDGKFNFELPKTITDDRFLESLTVLNDLFECELAISQPETRLQPGIFLYAKQGETYLGYLLEASSPKWVWGSFLGFAPFDPNETPIAEVGDAVILRTYAENDVTVKAKYCTIREISVSPFSLETTHISFDLNYKKGWNFTVVEVKAVNSETGNIKEVSLETRVPPKDVKWFFIPYSGTEPANCTEPLVIPDPNLELAIRNELDKQSADLSCADIELLNHLSASYGGISDLTGLQFAINLQFLDLGYNGVADISVLAGLTSLQYLDLEYNSVTDISPLTDLTNLQSLNLAKMNLSDLKALTGLINLQTLQLFRNNIDDISALSSLINLQNLRLYSNHVSDLSPLSALVNLQYLELHGNSINDISYLSGLANLQTLSLGNNNISDIKALSSLINLQNLSLNKNSIGDISSLKGLINLKYLGLEDNYVQDVQALVDNVGLGSKDRLSIYNNCLDLTKPPDSTNISILEARLVQIMYDPQKITGCP